MPALSTETIAPDFSLPLLQGGKFSLQQALKQGPVLLAFFKSSCPVCQFALPYVERLFQAYGNRNASVVAVSQDDVATTKAFAKEFRLTLPIALDDTARYPVSNAYGLTNVPTLFLVRPSGEIEISCVGWSRQDVEQMGRELAQAGQSTPVPIIHKGEAVPDFKAG
jgi:peroxiredoxin